MKRIILSISLLLGATLFAQDDLVNSLSKNQSEKSKEGFKFTTIINLNHSPVKNQGSSGTCWSYSGNSFLESEMIKKGKQPVDISEIYTARCTYIEKAKNYVKMHGHLSWGDGGQLHDVVNILDKYGAVPYNVYTGLNYGTKINRFAEMQSLLKGMLDGVIKNKNGKLTKNWLPAFTAVLDTYLGKVPESFLYEGKYYTPKTFADEVIGLKAKDFIELSAIPAEPTYEYVFFPVPDNWSFDYTFNVTTKDLTDVIDNALKKGYTVGWATDVSEKYFSWKNGVAFVSEKDYTDMTKEEREELFNSPKEERVITDEMRQEAFDNYTTTDDHGMQIVGLAKDQTGKEYYIVKNSWGTKNDHKGYLYVTKAFVQYKTTAILLNKKGLPKRIFNKI